MFWDGILPIVAVNYKSEIKVSGFIHSGNRLSSKSTIHGRDWLLFSVFRPAVWEHLQQQSATVLNLEQQVVVVVTCKI